MQKNIQYKEFLQINEPQLFAPNNPNFELQQIEESEERFLYAGLIPSGKQELLIQHHGKFYHKTVFIEIEKELPPLVEVEAKKKKQKK